MTAPRTTSTFPVPPRLRRLWPAAAIVIVVGIALLMVRTVGVRRTRSGVVSAATPKAAQAGAQVLRDGGNAIDAAVASALTLFVTEPAGSGLGGQTSLIVQRPASAAFAVNGTSFAPAAVPADAAAEDLIGRRLSTVPNAVATLDYALSTFGSGKISWARALQPAIAAAEDGFVLGPFRRTAIAKYRDAIAADPATARVFLRADGSVPPVGATIRQPTLGKTLRRLAAHGASDFYRGSIAEEIGADMVAHGGWLTAEDLGHVAPPIVTAPVAGRYRDYDVYSLPPPAGGWVVAQMLGALGTMDVDTIRPRTADRTVAMARVLREGHRARANYPIPPRGAYVDEVARRTGPDGVAALADRATGSGETTHLSVIDRHGMAVGVTQSLNAYFGARVTHPTLGFLYNDYMKEFEVGKPGHAFELRAGAMPYSSMSATILSRSGEPQLVLGSPGSARIISAVVQVASGWVDDGQDIESAVAAPRIHPKLGTGQLLTEGATASEARTALASHGLTESSYQSAFSRGDLDPYFGGVHAVALERGSIRGAADPRRDGVVAYETTDDVGIDSIN